MRMVLQFIRLQLVRLPAYSMLMCFVVSFFAHFILLVVPINSKVQRSVTSSLHIRIDARPSSNQMPSGFNESLLPIVSEQPVAISGEVQFDTEGESAPPVLGRHFYSTSELSTKPKALYEPNLENEDVAKLMFSGAVILDIWIDDSGTVVDAKVQETDLPEAFSQAAENAFRELRFEPGELNGVKVNTLMRVVVEYGSPVLDHAP